MQTEQITISVDMPAPTTVLPQLYEADGSAWLEALARLIGEGHLQDLD